MGKDLKGKELGPNLRQVNPHKYEGRFVDRYKVRRSIYGKTLVETKRKLKEAIEKDAALQSVRKRIKMKDWYKSWMEVYKEPFIRPSTKLNYSNTYRKYIDPALGEMYMNDIKPIDVARVINQLRTKGYSWETQHRTKILILDMFSYAIDNNYAISDPTKGIRLTKPEDEDRYILKRGEQLAFFEISAGSFYNNLFVTLVNSGLRPGEAYALHESDLDFERHRIHVTKTLSYQKFDGDEKKEFHFGPPKTDSSERDVPMNTICEQALRKQLNLKRILAAKHPKEGEFANVIFATRMNTPLNAQIISDAIMRLVLTMNDQRDKLESLPYFTAHTFRHTFATRCIEGGMNPKALQKILGHSRLETTMNMYVHVTDEWMDDELGRLEEYMPRVEIPLVIDVPVGL